MALPSLGPIPSQNSTSTGGRGRRGGGGEDEGGGGEKERGNGKGRKEEKRKVMTWYGVAAYVRRPQCGNAAEVFFLFIVLVGGKRLW